MTRFLQSSGSLEPAISMSSSMIADRGTVSGISTTPGNESPAATRSYAKSGKGRDIMGHHDALLTSSPVQNLRILELARADLLHGHDIEVRLASLQPIPARCAPRSSARPVK